MSEPVKTWTQIAHMMQGCKIEGKEAGGSCLLKQMLITPWQTCGIKKPLVPSSEFLQTCQQELGECWKHPAMTEIETLTFLKYGSGLDNKNMALLVIINAHDGFINYNKITCLINLN